MTTPSKRLSLFSNIESHSPNELTPLHYGTSPSTTSRQYLPNLPNKPIFSNDQEIFLDSPTPLILLSDHQVVNPFQNSMHRTMNQSRLGTSYFFKNLDISSHATNTHTVNNSPSKKLDLLEQSEVEASEVLKTPKTTQSKRDFSEGTNGAREVSASGGVSGNDEPVDVFQINKVEGILDLTPRQARLKVIVDSTPFTAVFSFFVFYALYADDIRQVAFTVHADTVFDVFTVIVLLAFTIEISLNFYVDKAYRWSLFFFLDVISTLSFVLNLNFVSSSAFPTGTTNAAQIARASRASRVGTRAGRLVRVIRMFRVLKVFGNVNLKDKKKKNRVFPSMGSFSQNSDHGPVGAPLPNLAPRGSRLSRLSIKSEEDFSFQKKGAQIVPVVPSAMGSPGQVNTQQSLGTQMQFARKGTLKEEDFQRQDSGISSFDSNNGDLKESRVGKKLSDLTTKRVVVIVLMMLTFIPMFQSDFYFEDPASADYEVNLLAKLIDNTGVLVTTEPIAETYFIKMEVAHNPELLLLQLADTVIFSNTNVDRSDLRDIEMNKVSVSTKKGTLLCITNLKPDSVLESWLSMGRTTWTIVILIVGALLFSKDANVLLLRPIERMIKKVNRIAQNPLIAKEERLVRDYYNDGFDNETIEIENAIIKIGGLLALGYGDAGSTIIAHNMAQSGDLNPMLSGKKIAAIFGFCDIRNFTDATEVLQEEVMVFVNSIADVVHSIVDRYGGTANKNIGDAFLLAWKLPDEDVLEEEDGSLEIRNSPLVNNLADFALISFIKIQAKINRDPTLLAYRDDPRLISRLPNYKVKMGFGLHVGWAIEGAIGSDFKIDASYLSPNVNLASRLEAATKQYGVPLLFSGDVTRKMSQKMQEKVRLIDIVTLKGSVQPVALYTCDMDVNDLIIARNREKVSKAVRREKQKKYKEHFAELLFEGDAASILDEDKELQHLFRNNDPVFNNIFSTGFEAYINGDWSICKKKFEECLALRPEDGPTKSLMRFLKENDFIAPEGWEGFRALTEK